MPDQCQKGFCGWDQRCRCTGPSDCPGQRCDVTSGRCQNRLADGSFCLLPEDCQSGHCGTLFTTMPQCYTPGTRSMGEFCLAVDHCNGLACEPRCNWTLLDTQSPCHPVNVMLTFSILVAGQVPPAGIWTLEALAECGCETRCTCNDNDDCADDKYCGDLTIDGLPSGGLLNQCRSRKGPAEPCESNEECRSNDCSVCNFLGCACGCANSDQCWDGSYCSGNKCVLKKLPGLGCSGDVQCASGKCRSTFSGKVCVL